MPKKGFKMSAESRQKMSQSAKKHPSNRIGKKHSAETKAKISKIVRERVQRGPAHYNYKHGLSIRALNDRRKPEYTAWRSRIFERDKYMCQDCGDNRGGNLRAHHLQSFSTHPELRFEVSNGITLCHRCHELRHFKPDSIRNARKLKRGERIWK